MKNERLIFAIVVVSAITLGAAFIFSNIIPEYGFWVTAVVAAIGTIIALNQKNIIK
jgi:hypothetical protein